MDITLDFPSPLEEGVVRKFAEEAGLTREPPLKCFGGQIFSQAGTCGRIRIAVTEKRGRVVISTHYANAHMRSFQLLIIAKVAARLGEKPHVSFSQEFAHMYLSPWFPGGKRESNQIHFEGA